MRILRRITVYLPLCYLAAKTMWQVLVAGEKQYPVVRADAIINKAKHASHAKNHIDCYRELGHIEDLTHCAVRCILELARRRKLLRRK